MTEPIPFFHDRAAEIIAAYGGDTSRWPDAERATALAVIAGDPALTAALASPAFYLGCLGSKKTHALRLERLAAAGCSRLERLHGPVGLSIGAKSPVEIAVSIFAEIIATLRGCS